MNRRANIKNIPAKEANLVSMIISFSLIGFSMFLFLPLAPLRDVDKNFDLSHETIKKTKSLSEIIVIPRAPVMNPDLETKTINQQQKKNNVSQPSLQKSELSVKNRHNKEEQDQTYFHEGALLDQNVNKILSEKKIVKNALAGANNNSQKKSIVSITEGRFLLRMLEHGKGPEIIIGWPHNLSDRNRLYHVLRKCYGMKNAVISQKSALYSEKNLPGINWIPNTDLFSGFLRSPIGQPIRSESQTFKKIAQRHNLSIWGPVRIFPRNVDAMILSGLHNLIGIEYQKAKSVRANYLLKDGSSLYLHKITVDSKPVFGEIRIPLNKKLLCEV